MCIFILLQIPSFFGQRRYVVYLDDYNFIPFVLAIQESLANHLGEHIIVLQTFSIFERTRIVIVVFPCMLYLCVVELEGQILHFSFFLGGISLADYRAPVRGERCFIFSVQIAARTFRD